MHLYTLPYVPDTVDLRRIDISDSSHVRWTLLKQPDGSLWGLFPRLPLTVFFPS